MNPARNTQRMTTAHCAILGAIALLFAVQSCVGIRWGLPSRKIDKYLFAGEEPWPGEKIYRLAGAGEKFSPSRGADVDVDPLNKSTDEPINLTATEADVAKILLRYRLYTYQPDEMITMMALAGMRPSEFDFDPQLYQYGGLFIYPVGALIKLCGLLDLIDVRSDVVYYLDNPDEFGKFYIVARAYAAGWGLVGVLTVFAISRRLAGIRPALVAALLFTVMPVVVCMAHEGKPHLPGAVLMLLAVYFAMRHLGRDEGMEGHRVIWTKGQREETTEHDQSRDREGADPEPRASARAYEKRRTTTTPRFTSANFWLMCICCGAAFGMVLSSFPIFILIPLVAWMEEYSARLRRSHANRNQRTDHDAPTATSKSAEALRAAVNADEDSSSAGESQSDTTPLPHGRGSDPDLATASRLRRPSILRSLDPSPSRRRWLSKTATGVLLAAAVYLITNPYILINAFVNREVLQSNFSNSLAMYEIARIGEGFVRVLKLTAEGATTPILVLGTIAVMVAFWRRRFAMLPLAIPALVFFTQFVLIGAGKPAEYGRFGVFTNTALAIGTACVLGRRWTTRLRDVVNWLPVVPVVLWVATFGALYLMGFVADSGTNNTRIMLAGYMADLAEYMKHDGFPRHDKRVALLQEPAPYSCPPLPFAQRPVLLFAKHRFDQADLIRPGFTVHITPRDYVAELNQYDRQVVNPPASYFPPSTTFFVPMPLSSFVSFGGENYDPFNPPWGGSMLCGSPTPISWANKPFMNFAVWRFDSKPQDAEPRQGPPAP